MVLRYLSDVYYPSNDGFAYIQLGSFLRSR